jgi:molybdopterin converting factor small subunit
MKIRIRAQLFSSLRDAAGLEYVDLELRDGASVNDLLVALFARFPTLEAWKQSILVGAGVEFVGREHLLKEGEEISIMPPVQGG